MATKKMARDKKKSETVVRHKPASISKLNPEFHRLLKASLAAGAVKGSCLWQDNQGGFHCAGDVTKDACDNLNGQFTPNGSC